MSWVDIGCLICIGLLTFGSLVRIMCKLLSCKDDFITQLAILFLAYLITILLMLMLYKFSLLFQH